MKRTTLFFFFPLILIGQFAFGQSPKKLNKVLTLRYEREKEVYDSIMQCDSVLRKQLADLKQEMGGIHHLFYIRRVEADASRYRLIHNYRLLSDCGYDAKSIVSEPEVNAVVIPDVARQYRINKDGVLNRDFKLRLVGEVKDPPAELKWKTRNLLLGDRIQLYDSLNRLNRVIVKEEQDFFAWVLKAKEEYQARLKQVWLLTVQLDERSDLLAAKYVEVKKQQEEQRKREYRQELLEAKKRRKSGLIAFIPPLVVDRELDESSLPVLSSSVKKETDSTILANYRYEPVLKYEEPRREPVVLDFVDEPASFPGGIPAMKEFIAKNLCYTDSMKEMGIQGRVYLKIEVSETGEISNVKVARGIPDCKACDAEAIRVIKLMPKWIPGKVNGVPVNSFYNLPVKFSME